MLSMARERPQEEALAGGAADNAAKGAKKWKC
jgi:hypothetical protein